MNLKLEQLQHVTRRQFLKSAGQLSLGAIALQTLGGSAQAMSKAALNPLAPNHPHFPAKAKRVIASERPVGERRRDIRSRGKSGS